MSTVHASGLSVRHAVARALATHNRRPNEATWRILAARVSVDGAGRVTRADVTVRVEPPIEGLGDPRAQGLVNPTGEAPLAVLLSGTSCLLDVLPVAWARWLELRGGVLPDGVEPWTLRAGVTFNEAAAFATLAGARLPTTSELRAAWGPARFPWGDAPDPARGLGAPLRWGEVPELGLFPPNPSGAYDLGAGAGAWTAEGTVFGAVEGDNPDGLPFVCGLRLARTL